MDITPGAFFLTEDGLHLAQVFHFGRNRSMQFVWFGAVSSDGGTTCDMQNQWYPDGTDVDGYSAWNLASRLPTPEERMLLCQQSLTCLPEKNELPV